MLNVVVTDVTFACYRLLNRLKSALALVGSVHLIDHALTASRAI